MSKIKSIYEPMMAQILTNANYKFQREFRFCPPRRWRFDFVLEPVKTKIAIEINGGAYLKGKHNYGESYTKDLEKLNMAQIMGWVVLQYTPDILPNVIKDLQLLCSSTPKT